MNPQNGTGPGDDLKHALGDRQEACDMADLILQDLAVTRGTRFLR